MRYTNPEVQLLPGKSPLPAGNYDLLMPPAPKKPPQSPGKGRKSPPRQAKAEPKTRLSREEAEVRMMEVTTDLLLALPPAEVTVHRISEGAGVHHDYVARYFGSREELLARAVEHATIKTVVELNPTNMEQALSIITTDGEALRLFALRGKLITYLLGCGVPPQRFKPTQGLLLERAVSMSTNRDVSDRTRRNMILTVTLLVHAIGTMSEVYGLSDTERQDLLSIAANIGSFANTIEETLGWGSEEGKPSR